MGESDNWECVHRSAAPLRRLLLRLGHDCLAAGEQPADSVDCIVLNSGYPEVGWAGSRGRYPQGRGSRDLVHGQSGLRKQRWRSERAKEA